MSQFVLLIVIHSISLRHESDDTHQGCLVTIYTGERVSIVCMEGNIHMIQMSFKTLLSSYRMAKDKYRMAQERWNNSLANNRTSACTPWRWFERRGQSSLRWRTRRCSSAARREWAPKLYPRANYSFFLMFLLNSHRKFKEKRIISRGLPKLKSVYCFTS